MGHLKEKDLILTETNSYELISPHTLPINCRCFQNEGILGIGHPVLLELELETGRYEYQIWNEVGFVRI